LLEGRTEGSHPRYIYGKESRLAAAKAISLLGNQAAPAVDALVQAALRDDDISLREEAGITLGKLGELANACVPQIELTLQQAPKCVGRSQIWDTSTQPTTHTAALSLLNKLGPIATPVIPELQKFWLQPAVLCKNVQWTVVLVARIIGHGGDAAASMVPLLGPFLVAQGFPEVREAVADALARLGDVARPAFPELRAVLILATRTIRAEALKRVPLLKNAY